MISIIFHKNFEKQYIKLKEGDKKRFKEKTNVFSIDQFNPILNNHPLKGKYKGYRSINISGDLRAIYKMKTKSCFVFVAIDNHSNLYK